MEPREGGAGRAEVEVAAMGCGQIAKTAGGKRPLRGGTARDQCLRARGPEGEPEAPAPMGVVHGHSSRAAAWAATGRLATSTWRMPVMDPWTQPRSRHAASTETTTAWGQARAAAAALKAGTEMTDKPAATVRARAARDAPGSSAALKWPAEADTGVATSATGCAVRGRRLAGSAGLGPPISAAGRRARLPASAAAASAPSSGPSRRRRNTRAPRADWEGR